MKLTITFILCALFLFLSSCSSIIVLNDNSSNDKEFFNSIFNESNISNSQKKDLSNIVYKLYTFNYLFEEEIETLLFNLEKNSFKKKFHDEIEDLLFKNIIAQKNVLNLKIKTSKKNKELIIESLLKENIKFNIDFNFPNSFELKEDILNSKNKFFCKSFIDEQQKLIDKNVFILDRDLSKKILIVYSKENLKKIERLKKDYPDEIYYLIDSSNLESDVQMLLKAYDSNQRLSLIESLDKKITIEHFPRSRNDIDKVYFLLDYQLGKTIIPIYRNLDFGSKLFSNTKIIHGANNINDLADFESISLPINKQMIKRIAEKNDITNIKSELEKMVISDYLILEKVKNNNFYSSEIYLSSGFADINENECISRNIPMWKVDINGLTDQI
ncbi:MAG: hypothetical protein ACJ0FG_01680 [Gammaproteobacteria bacterium]|tara:strand:- start:3490 stop:4647 length:1158 start_codon:yes stop_codon:yes gene_type:complete